MGTQLQGLLHQGDVLHAAARLDAKRGRDDHLGLRGRAFGSGSVRGARKRGGNVFFF